MSPRGFGDRGTCFGSHPGTAGKVGRGRAALSAWLDCLSCLPRGSVCPLLLGECPGFQGSPEHRGGLVSPPPDEGPHEGPSGARGNSAARAQQSYRSLESQAGDSEPAERG